MIGQKNRATILISIGLILFLVSFAVPSGLTITPTSPLAFNFTDGINPWVLSLYGSGNAATLTQITSTPSDPHARLTCTSYNTASNGWVGANYVFQSNELNVGESYTVTFDYMSDTNFNFQYISQNENWEIIDQYYTTCSASNVWTSNTLTIPSIQSATHYVLSINIYNPGSINFDTIYMTLNPVITPTPSPSPTPSPQSTDASVTLIGIGGGILMTYNGLTFPTSGLASTTYQVPMDTTVTLTATNVEQGNEFSHWEFNGIDHWASSGNLIIENPIQKVINEDTVIKAIYTTVIKPPTSFNSNLTLAFQIGGALIICVGIFEWLRSKNS